MRYIERERESITVSTTHLRPDQREPRLLTLLESTSLGHHFVYRFTTTSSYTDPLHLPGPYPRTRPVRLRQPPHNANAEITKPSLLPHPRPRRRSYSVQNTVQERKLPQRTHDQTNYHFSLRNKKYTPISAPQEIPSLLLKTSPIRHQQAFHNCQFQGSRTERHVHCCAESRNDALCATAAGPRLRQCAPPGGPAAADAMRAAEDRRWLIRGEQWQCEGLTKRKQSASTYVWPLQWPASATQGTRVDNGPTPRTEHGCRAAKPGPTPSGRGHVAPGSVRRTLSRSLRCVLFCQHLHHTLVILHDALLIPGDTVALILQTDKW